MEMVAGVQTKEMRFTCPVFKTKHSISTIPLNVNGKLVYTAKYRGHHYWLTQYFNNVEQCAFYRFGLIEKRSGGPLLRHIADIAADLRTRYIYDLDGVRGGKEKFA